MNEIQLGVRHQVTDFLANKSPTVLRCSNLFSQQTETERRVAKLPSFLSSHTF